MLHKMVNGVKVDLTPDEEAEIKAEWLANKTTKLAKRESESLNSKMSQKEMLEALWEAHLTQQT